MTISVHYAVELPKDHPLYKYAPPAGFPLVVIEEEGKVIEPIFLFLIYRYVRTGKRNWKQHTADAVAYDLRDWFDYLSYLEWTDPLTSELKTGKPWDLATETDYIHWRDVMQDLISPLTGRPLRSRTISRRQASVEQFYRHASGSGWYKGAFLISKIKKGRVRDFSLHYESEDDTASMSAYREADDMHDRIHPLLPAEWSQVRQALGPLPSEKNFDFPSRDRLACELSLVTGMRVDEVASLTDLQILNLHNEWSRVHPDEREITYFKLPLTKTKNLRARVVLVPGYLVAELINYIDSERTAALTEAKIFSEKQGKAYKSTATLFLNHANAGRNAGKAIRPQTLSLAFKKACITSGITVIIERLDIKKEMPYRMKRSAHTFHDLRHTFSVWKYHTLREQGVSEPWKEIQILLGHSQLKTTIDTYLAAVEIDREQAGKIQYAAKKRIGTQGA